MAKQRPADGEGGQPAQKVKPRSPVKKKKKSNAIVYVLIFLILLLLGVAVVALMFLLQNPDIETKISEADEVAVSGETQRAIDQFKAIQEEHSDVMPAEQGEKIKT